MANVELTKVTTTTVTLTLTEAEAQVVATAVGSCAGAQELYDVYNALMKAGVDDRVYKFKASGSYAEVEKR